MTELVVYTLTSISIGTLLSAILASRPAEEGLDTICDKE